MISRLGIAARAFRPTVLSPSRRRNLSSIDEATEKAKAERRERIRQALEQRKLEALQSVDDPSSAAPRTSADLAKTFLAGEAAREAAVDETRLTDADKEIRVRHRAAAAALEQLYEDPKTGLMVVTRWKHFLKGKCCGNACRHCIYDHERVKPERKEKRRFNTAFWEDISKN